MTIAKMRLYFIVIISLLAACSEENGAETQKAAPKKAAEEIVVPTFFLNNKNAPDTLAKYYQANKNKQVVLATKYGEITFQLSEKTPIHSGNFLYLIQEKQYYDSTLFYRVADNFLIQGGDADNFLIANRKFAVGEYALPMEFDASLFHKRGALAMCRHYDNENDGLSTSFDFYIVIGEKASELQLQALERKNNIKFTDHQRKVYKSIGGTPHLDGEHTIFGHVTSGMDVVIKISEIATDSQDWPDENIFISARLK